MRNFPNWWFQLQFSGSDSETPSGAAWVCGALACMFVSGTIVAAIVQLEGAVGSLLMFAVFGDAPNAYVIAANSILVATVVAWKVVEWRQLSHLAESDRGVVQK